MDLADYADAVRLNCLLHKAMNSNSSSTIPPGVRELVRAGYARVAPATAPVAGRTIVSCGGPRAARQIWRRA